MPKNEKGVITALEMLLFFPLTKAESAADGSFIETDGMSISLHPD